MRNSYPNGVTDSAVEAPNGILVSPRVYRGEVRYV